MKEIRHHRLALIFALLSCLIPPLDKAIVTAYPDQKFYFSLENLTRGTTLFIDDDTATRSGMYKGYTVHERMRAVVSLLGLTFCLLAFFIGRAGLNGAYGKKRDLCIIAATIGLCSSASYTGGAFALILFLVFMLRLQQKDEVPKSSGEQYTHSPSSIS